MNRLSTESSSDTIICDLHRIREEIVDSFGGDLRRLTDDARRRQEASGKRIWRRGEAPGWKRGQTSVLDRTTLNLNENETAR